MWWEEGDGDSSRSMKGPSQRSSCCRLSPPAGRLPPSQASMKAWISWLFCLKYLASVNWRLLYKMAYIKISWFRKRLLAADAHSPMSRRVLLFSFFVSFLQFCSNSLCDPHLVTMWDVKMLERRKSSDAGSGGAEQRDQLAARPHTQAALCAFQPPSGGGDNSHLCIFLPHETCHHTTASKEKHPRSVEGNSFHFKGVKTCVFSTCWALSVVRSWICRSSVFRRSAPKNLHQSKGDFDANLFQHRSHMN